MDPRARTALLAEARRWAGLGLVDPAKLPAIEALYPEEPGEVGTPQLVLFGLGGAIATAAVVAFCQAVLRLHDKEFAVVVASTGLAAFVGGVALRQARRLDWADAAFVAAAIAFALGPFPRQDLRGLLAFLPLGAGVAIPWLAHRRGGGPGLGVLCFAAGLLATVWAYFSSSGFIFPDVDPGGGWLALGAASAYMAGAVVWARLDPSARPAHQALSAVGLLLATGLFVATVVLPGHGRTDLQWLLMALPQLGLVAVGYVLREQQLLLGASLCSAVALTVFAFAVGGPLFGVATLLALAAAFILLALRLRRLPGSAPA